MKTIILKKWIEPYKLLELVKENSCRCSEFTFNGSNKERLKQDFLQQLSDTKNAAGLYMKNVNKYYYFEPKEDIKSVWNNLCTEFQFSESDFDSTEDIGNTFFLVDMGKAEAGIILQ